MAQKKNFHVLCVRKHDREKTILNWNIKAHDLYEASCIFYDVLLSNIPVKEITYLQIMSAGRAHKEKGGK